MQVLLAVSFLDLRSRRDWWNVAELSFLLKLRCFRGLVYGPREATSFLPAVLANRDFVDYPPKKLICTGRDTTHVLRLNLLSGVDFLFMASLITIDELIRGYYNISPQRPWFLKFRFQLFNILVSVNKMINRKKKNWLYMASWTSHSWKLKIFFFFD